MKATLPLFFTLLFFSLQAQQTHEISWHVGINESDASLVIETGDTVKWTWADSMPHDVSSTDPDAPSGFGSAILTGVGQTYEFTFTEEAVFDYGCSVHPSDMFGTITVEDALNIQDKFIQNLKYYPNPVSETLTITSLVPFNLLKIHNIEGKQIIQKEMKGDNSFHIDLIHLKTGVYFIEVFAENQKNTIFKIVKL